ncbi:hypothetical protein SEA_MAYA_42 [Streptomyces phage Maya]|uniref:Uncharacterized protein n=9 Tax=Rimavirus rima TaxID=2560784 RepID=A0A515MIP6_9CAUD|nr:hypothetical protein SEA_OLYMPICHELADO_42 [Streptomyces phage OlympicHelado]ASU04037.1 hypothetical protein SEA_SPECTROPATRONM_42 [Streptomyces phage Spectropatronm]QAY16253.1 hypothetical protein SEA_ICEWARRIOR_41 [Streptomyces phage IceWarrior]QDM56543.1 hypothetical protein SEA_ESKETIT_42 [Streptomyces phage Esketit]QEQ93735.1 hypothetical protein SEA_JAYLOCIRAPTOR_42 [Streptomyces phage Jaylociraptor]QEQ94259.1 hypothetical protein SEA_HOSHI_42 [Streptomyces phage Hoshi]QGJ96741.1 hypo
MQAKVEQPDPNYPLVWVTATPNAIEAGIADILEKKRITLLGMWGPDENNTPGIRMAPALLEDEHTKPPKRRTRKG